MSTAEEGKQIVQSVDAGPQVNILYSAPIQTASTQHCLYTFGSHVTLNEAKSMMFVDQNTETVPVPKIYAYYSHCPIDRDIGDYGSLYDKYIFMSYLKGYSDGLHQIEHSNSIGSVDHGPVADLILGGPLFSEDGFVYAISNAYQSRAPKRHIKNVLASMLSSQQRNNSVFTHGDVCVLNIMVHNGNISGIVDWDLSGYFYWYHSIFESGQKLHAIVPSHCDHLPVGPSESVSKRPARIAPVAPPPLPPLVPSRALFQPMLGATICCLSANDSPELLPVAVMSLAARLPGLSTQPICFLQSFARSPQ
ncbi:hypothetical protein BDQ94DRAFT_159337 [Aspergillus welwitschiae]|uniref:Aminoglycoside phosphotransferase domain-containing protein n=1 Tax=Aspergillus welwitschiae TaxID=1341132 RepID=A0A3F3Q2Y7_9EURO|nr:hypothetical protein BDQ94DRAFT_159337 [Aspergillus welwitschiae]RDH33538.1 hypothetical protein BDQ94DRAFT_159337 [Aspergillus welwitschiae]